MLQKHWDIFCNVIDNYGDIGVCWRLARQLATEYDLQIRLWVDDLKRFQPLCPELDPAQAQQYLHGIDIRHWPSEFPALEPAQTADVVIEAFACELPQNYLAAMAGRTRKPVWINLEYLSAEAWVSRCHGLTSPHPQRPLTKHFFFPGFGSQSGGLLREQQLFAQRDAWQAEPGSAFTRLGLSPSAPEQLNISLFSYENPGLPALLQTWTESTQPIRCLVPQGRALEQIATILDRPALQPHDTYSNGQLTLQALPFVRQRDCDLLLWSCDLNFVRGEDSFVRALWAGRPLIWHIYPQTEDAHLPKLHAFLDLYCANLSPALAGSLRDFWLSWNGHAANPLPIGVVWQTYIQHLTEHRLHARYWADQQAQTPDLARQLVNFCQNLL